MIFIKKDIKINESEKEEIINLLINVFSHTYPILLLYGKHALHLPIEEDIYEYYTAWTYDNKLVGFVKYIIDPFKASKHIVIDPYSGENVCDLCVSEDYRKQGIARKLLDSIAKDHGKMILSINNDDTKILEPIYQKLGFVKYKIVEDKIYFKK